MRWTQEKVTLLQELLNKGVSFSGIGRQLGCTKSAVSGKVSQLKKSKEDAPPATPSSAAPVAVALPEPRPPSGSEPLFAQFVPRNDRTQTCLWPLGEPGERGFHFCDKRSVPGKSYCEEHAALAYVKVRDRREVAA